MTHKIVMFNPFVCGSGSFHHGDEDRDDPWSPSAPRRSKSCRNSSSSNKMGKNPFSTRGLDKFAMVLAELDERRQKIYEQMGLEDEHSLVRFGYSSSKGNWVPIVVKLKRQKVLRDPPSADNHLHQKLKGIKTNIKSEIRTHDQQQNSEARNINVKQEVVGNKKPVDEEKEQKKETKKKNKSLSFSFSVQSMLGKPYYYLAFVVILILLCLVIYGRSFAIICTSISWYLVPTIKGRSSYKNLRRKSMKKKEFVKSEGLLVASSALSPKAKNMRQGLSPRKHGNNRE